MSKDFYQMNDLRKILASNSKITSLLNLVRMILEKFKNHPSDVLVKSNELGFLKEEMEKIHIQEIEDLLEGIDNPETIIALPLSIEKYFTLFFVIVPSDQ
jgi:hypothetical protein